MVRDANAAGLAVRTATSDPCRAAGSRPTETWRSAAIDTYSAPWMPAVTATRGPGRAPLTTTIGSSTVADPRSTATRPVTRVPAAAVSGPTVTGGGEFGAIARGYPTGRSSSAPGRTPAVRWRDAGQERHVARQQRLTAIAS